MYGPSTFFGKLEISDSNLGLTGLVEKKFASLTNLTAALGCKQNLTLRGGDNNEQKITFGR